MEKEIRDAIHNAALIAALEAKINYDENKKIIPTKICDSVEKFVWDQFKTKTEKEKKMKIQLIKSDNTIHHLTVGYTWDKGGYEKHYAIKDNDRKILFIHNGVACDALQEHKMLDFVRSCFGLGRITWNGFRLRFTKICHEDSLDKLVERGWKIVGDWDDNFNNFRIIEQ